MKPNQVTRTLSRGAQWVISSNHAKTYILWFTLVYHTTCAVNESVCMALFRCRNSGALWFLLGSVRLALRPETLTLEQRGNYQHSQLASPANSVGHDADSQQQKERIQPHPDRVWQRGTETRRQGWRSFVPVDTTGYPLGIKKVRHHIVPLRECLACAFPVFLQLWSLVESLLCSSKAEMWGEGTLSETGTQISADGARGRNISRSHIAESSPKHIINILAYDQ